jgi:predicted DNA-binding transcriptional regulator AlpA
MDYIAWPKGVAKRIGLSAKTLVKRRLDGDAPKLFQVSPRKLVTTEAELARWVTSKSVAPAGPCRQPRGGAQA